MGWPRPVAWPQPSGSGPNNSRPAGRPRPARPAGRGDLDLGAAGRAGDDAARGPVRDGVPGLATRALEADSHEGPRSWPGGGVGEKLVVASGSDRILYVTEM